MRKQYGDKGIMEYKNAQYISNKEDIYFLPVDVLVPGARPYVIDKSNVGKVQAKIISSIANIPITDEAEEILFKRGIYSVPDFISNAGGVVLAVVDMLGGTADDVLNALSGVLGPLTTSILADAKQEGNSPRSIAVRNAKRAVLDAGRQGETTKSFQETLSVAKQRFGMK